MSGNIEEDVNVKKKYIQGSVITSRFTWLGPLGDKPYIVKSLVVVEYNLLYLCMLCVKVTRSLQVEWWPCDRHHVLPCIWLGFKTY